MALESIKKLKKVTDELDLILFQNKKQKETDRNSARTELPEEADKD